MRKIKFSSNTIRENQNNINDNFDDIEKVAQEIVENVESVDKKIPTKTSQLINDGDGSSNFDTTSSVDGKISTLRSYVSDELKDKVTLDTEQKITATKTFKKIRFNNDINIEMTHTSDDGNENIIIGDADGQNGEESIVIGIGNISNLTGEKNIIVGTNSKSTGNSVVVGNGCKSDGSNNVNIGVFNTNESVASVSIGSQLSTQGSTAINIGYHGRVYDDDGISIGNFSISLSENAIAIGKNALSGAKDAIQLGSGSNSRTKTLQVFEYQLLDENGKIPEDRLPETIGTDYVDTKIAELVNSAPETLDTLGELSTAIQNNSSVVEALNTAISNKANLSDVNSLSNKVLSLQENLDKKANISSLSEVATTGSFNDLKNIPKIPTKISDLTNDSYFITDTINSIKIGENATSTGGYATSVGYGAQSGQDGVSIGVYSQNIGTGSIAIGASAKALNKNIQIGLGQNNFEKTFQVYNYQMLDANGNIPIERLANVTSLIETSITGVLNTEV